MGRVLLVRHIEHHVRQPAFEIRVVAELLEQFCVVGQQLQHNPVECLVVLQLGVLAVGVDLRVLTFASKAVAPL